MSKSNEPKPASRERGSFGFMVLLVVLAMVGYIALRWNRSAEPQLGGAPLPPLEVAGWFNVERPVSNEDLRGKVVLVDCWYVGCAPCRAAMPHLVEFNKRFRGSGLAIIGLTVDAGSDVARAEEFVKSVRGLDWPIGYGAQIPVVDILGVRAFPTLILFDKSGRSVWASHGFGGLEEAVVKALAE